jgi:hypothetical protein
MRDSVDFEIRADALCVAVAVFASVVLALPAAAAADSAAMEQWRATDRSMAELVDDGYELVSVVPSSGQAHTYFLRKPGKVARVPRGDDRGRPSAFDPAVHARPRSEERCPATARDAENAHRYRMRRTRASPARIAMSAR